ncbi:MAG: ribonuclease J, partial [Clostridia bacterium]|nr:ribonuclease J [Clostridia bacterium]
KVNKKVEKKSAKKSTLKLIPLGGLNEIGKNMTLYEYGNDIFIVDCGMTFPTEEMPGVDIVIPDFTYAIQNKDRIKGIIITHGHEDHIGGLPYFLKNANIPIYGTKMTLGLIKIKLKEHGLLQSAKLKEVRPGDKVKLGCFVAEFIHVNHSIPDAIAIAVKTPIGTIVQTGDFKIDATPIDGDVIDLARFARLGQEGVLALLMDSTNATRPGFTMSESKVGATFSQFFKHAAKKRIVVATFSSNIHRVQQIVDEAIKCKRKVCVSGRSMENVVATAMELGYLSIPSGVLIPLDTIHQYKDDQLVIITTGSQGEPMSALHRMAFNDHRQINVGPNDLIIISATPIPGNEKMVNTVVNELMKKGAQVIYERMYDVHVSGHACQEELKLILSLTKPKYFIPVHGEQMHLRKNAELALELGIHKDRIVIGDIGKIIELSEKKVRLNGEVPSGKVMVDGLGVGDVGNLVLRERKHLSEDGVIVVALSVDCYSGQVVAGPELISRGFIYVKENDQLLEDARKHVAVMLDSLSFQSNKDLNHAKNKIRDSLSRYIYQVTHKAPMVLPIILEV